MSRLLDFYRGAATDHRGRTLAQIWSWDDEALETVHDFIQWLFPLPEPSNFNPNAPLLTEEDIAAFRNDAALRANLRRSHERFLTFLGLERKESGAVEEGPNLATRAPEVWDEPNHNWLRVTRVLRCLRLLGLEAESQALYDRLEAFRSEGRFPIEDDSFRYWTAAVRGEAFPR